MFPVATYKSEFAIELITSSKNEIVNSFSTILREGLQQWMDLKSICPCLIDDFNRAVRCYIFFHNEGLENEEVVQTINAARMILYPNKKDRDLRNLPITETFDIGKPEFTKVYSTKGWKLCKNVEEASLSVFKAYLDVADEEGDMSMHIEGFHKSIISLVSQIAVLKAFIAAKKVDTLKEQVLDNIKKFELQLTYALLEHRYYHAMFTPKPAKQKQAVVKTVTKPELPLLPKKNSDFTERDFNEMWRTAYDEVDDEIRNIEEDEVRHELD